jgi:hypothetical protein
LLLAFSFYLHFSAIQSLRKLPFPSNQGNPFPFVTVHADHADIGYLIVFTRLKRKFHELARRLPTSECSSRGMDAKITQKPVRWGLFVHAELMRFPAVAYVVTTIFCDHEASTASPRR